MRVATVAGRAVVIAVLSALSWFAPAAEPQRKTAVLHDLGSLEPLVAEALQKAEVPVEVVHGTPADFRIELNRRFGSRWAEVLYYKQTGRRDESELRVVDGKTGAVILSYRFHLEPESEATKKAVRTFAERLRARLR